MATVFLAFNVHYRHHRYIKMSSPQLNNLIIIGCMLTYSSIVVLGLDSGLSSVEAFPYICTARVCTLMAGFTLAFGAMFSKIWRVHSIFTDVKLNKKIIKDFKLFMVVGVLLAVDLIILVTWQVWDPFYRDTKQLEPYPHPSNEDIVIIPENEYCASAHMTVFMGAIYVYKGTLMVFGAFLAWETRHVSIPALNDSRHVGLSVYNVAIMCVCGAAVALVLRDHQDALFLIIGVFVLFCTTATLWLVFVPKLLELKRNPSGAIDKRVRATLRPMAAAAAVATSAAAAAATSTTTSTASTAGGGGRFRGGGATGHLQREESSSGASVHQLDARMREVKALNVKYRQILMEKDAELQMLMRKREEDDAAAISRRRMSTHSVDDGDAVKRQPQLSSVTAVTCAVTHPMTVTATPRRVSVPTTTATHLVAKSELWDTGTVGQHHRSSSKTHHVTAAKGPLLSTAAAAPTTILTMTEGERMRSRMLMSATGKLGSSTPNVFKGGQMTQLSMAPSAVATTDSETELLLLDEASSREILPIFHKLLTERYQRHDTNGGGGKPWQQQHPQQKVDFGRSCPNISIKCDIVEYL